MTITINNQKLELTNEQVIKLKKALNLDGKQLADIAIGDTFKVADIEFIHFGNGVAVAKDILFDAKFDDNTNNFAKSSLLLRLKKEVLSKIEAEVGAKNVLEFETDLWALDGTDEYGKMKSKISLPTIDFYRQNRKIFSKHHISKWWWLSTPDSTNNSSGVRCVDGDGSLFNYYCSGRSGVRPFLIFNPSIFVSC